ncbi:hypothetical protein JG688_00013977 [Phytophthora aleatoria]|uniref:Uncharacterized protein n=1 Tax=Phytophthora aleatoria TaxID=2496075 RepID=A0A8J5LXV0_9STRA|nr:hypothetical protein JG688_00013977 [Phytophthora aleatoria]
MTARTSSSVKGIPTGQTPLGSVKSKAASPSNNDEDAKKQNMDNPTPSVHPIDTLSRKLRQQAMELTHVYEELEKQNVKIDAYKQQIEDQKLQLEKLREKRRKSIDGSSKTSRSSRTAALEQQKRATQMMIGTPSTGASLGQKREELDCKLKEAEREKKKYQLAAKRIEKALVELQVFQNDRMEKLLPSEGESNQVEDSDFQAVLNEQRAYIRVLEEAVHLKATDFEITGHEELLVVLAELRHTIYEQEKDVGSLREESSKKQSHLDEMNALQEELLGSVDKYVGKVKKSRDKVDRLEAELESCKEKEALTQKQLQEAARSSDERVSILKAEVDAAEQRTQQIQAQRTALEQEKNRLEDALAEVQQQLEGQEQERNEQQQEIAEKEQRYHQMEEAVAELEAALSTVLMMMLGKTPDPSEKQSMTEDEKDYTDKHAFLLDQSVLRELETCSRVATIGERVVNEVNRALASWARERTNLVEACATLDATAKMCQNEMEKRHDEIQDYQEQLAERASEVEAYAMQLDTLDEQLRSAQAECEAFYALEEHATRQEEALQAKQALIRDLSAENDRLSAVENAYSVQVATNARYSQRLEDQYEAIKEQKQCAKELEQALENAANFAEEQNECNQQLQSQLAEMEISQRKQADLAKTLEVQNAAFSSRFLRLIKQYTTFLPEKEEAQLAEQLELIRGAFQSYKGDVETER